MRCFKLLGEQMMSRDFDRQVAELQVRAALLNRLTQLGTPVTVAMPYIRLGQGGTQPSEDLCKKAGN